MKLIREERSGCHLPAPPSGDYMMIDYETAIILVALGGHLLANEKLNQARNLRIEHRISKLEGKIQTACVLLKRQGS